MADRSDFSSKSSTDSGYTSVSSHSSHSYTEQDSSGRLVIDETGTDATAQQTSAAVAAKKATSMLPPSSASPKVASLLRVPASMPIMPGLRQIAPAIPPKTTTSPRPGNKPGDPQRNVVDRVVVSKRQLSQLLHKLESSETRLLAMDALQKKWAERAAEVHNLKLELSKISLSKPTSPKSYSSAEESMEVSIDGPGESAWVNVPVPPKDEEMEKGTNASMIIERLTRENDKLRKAAEMTLDREKTIMRQEKTIKTAEDKFARKNHDYLILQEQFDKLTASSSAQQRQLKVAEEDLQVKKNECLQLQAQLDNMAPSSPPGMNESLLKQQLVQDAKLHDSEMALARHQLNQKDKELEMCKAKCQKYLAALTQCQPPSGSMEESDMLIRLAREKSILEHNQNLLQANIQELEKQLRVLQSEIDQVQRQKECLRVELLDKRSKDSEAITRLGQEVTLYEDLNRQYRERIRQLERQANGASQWPDYSADSARNAYVCSQCHNEFGDWSALQVHQKQCPGSLD